MAEIQNVELIATDGSKVKVDKQKALDISEVIGSFFEDDAHDDEFTLPFSGNILTIIASYINAYNGKIEIQQPLVEEFRNNFTGDDNNMIDAYIDLLPQRKDGSIDMEILADLIVTADYLHSEVLLGFFSAAFAFYGINGKTKEEIFATLVPGQAYRQVVKLPQDVSQQKIIMNELREKIFDEAK